MFRKQRRFVRRAVMALPPDQLQALSQANQLWQAGHPAQAADILARLATTLQAENHPRRAANLHAQAAHAFTESGDEARALLHAQAALRLFIQYQMARRVPQFYANITRKLQERSMKAAALQIESEFGPRIGPLPPQPQPAGRLPASCPHCGAPVRSDEVEWIDAASAECIFCGSTLQTSE